MDTGTFVTKWSASGAAERANKDHFLLDLCDVLGVERPRPATGDPERDSYTFERDAVLLHEGQRTSAGKMDLYKAGHFILEAKQGSEAGARKLGTAKRGTAAWNLAMHDAYGQAVGYARTLAAPPPFIITTDIGHCFELFAAFDGTGRYAQFPDVKRHRIYLQDLARPENLDLLRTVFTAPRSLDPSQKATKVTREVATHLAALARDLEASGHGPERVARFLMRAIFTMFAEDVGLLSERLFTDALDRFWIPSPASFPAGIHGLWRAMNDGQPFGFFPKLLRFNGGLFKEAEGLPLTAEQLGLLREAAGCDWSEVEPSIFGTLLERALDPVERHRLGAHYTPRAYVERLVRPTVEEPLREAWDLVRAQVRALVERDEIKEARKALLTFQARLASTRVLDPACGTGNFLYVTLDLMKRLEAEVLTMLSDVEGGERGRKAGLSGEREGWAAVTPRQFLGIEVKPWAKEIAELVLWIGYIQWHFRTHGRDEKPAEPVLHDYGNIECRDAVLAWDDRVLERDEQGRPRSRWDGRTMKASPVTGEEVPDETAQVPLYRYVNPRRAEWPKADFIVGNPPFLGGFKLPGALGDGYAEALRSAHDTVPESVDLVMYWWNEAARRVGAGDVERAGLITTSSIAMTFNRRIVSSHLEQGISLAFAATDHPWTSAKYGSAKEDQAEVRIAMTVMRKGAQEGVLARVVKEFMQDDELRVEVACTPGPINADLTIGVDVTQAVPLMANEGLSSPGVKLHGSGFIVDEAQAAKLGLGRTAGLDQHIRPYRNGQDLAARPRNVRVIDLFGLSDAEVRRRFPEVYQWVLERVKPERDQNNRTTYRENWWIFGEPRRDFRPALVGLPRFITTVESSRRRYFVFMDRAVLPDNTTIAVALSDAFFLGVLSSRIHEVWSLAAGGRLGVRHDPRYSKSRCFDPFPFPACPETLRSRIGAIADHLDAHRRRQLALHPKLTLNNTYKVLAMVRAGTPLGAAEAAVNEQSLVSVLKQLHDDLDAAVFDAYGWPHDLTDEQILERLVKLNAERAAEEARGLVRWLRPDFQAAGAKQRPTQAALPGSQEAAVPAAAKAAAPWPKALPDQIASIRALLGPGDALSIKAVARAFKRADREAVEASLDALVALGLAVTFEVAGERRWRAAGRIAA